MSYWTDTAVLDLLWLGLLLFLASQANRHIGLLRRLALPPVLVAGTAGLLLGPGGFGLLKLHSDVLEGIAYHGLGVVFIAMGLMPVVAEARRSADARSAGFAIALFSVLQGLLGLVLVAIAGLFIGPVHPGVGLMLPLGFAQGPGQALSLGRAWEEGMGMTQGAQVGLAMATQGFFWCSVLGVALYHWGRRAGWLTPQGSAEGAASEAEARTSGEGPDLEPLTAHLATIAVIYLATWGVLQGLASALAGAPKIAASIFGFHFLIGLGLAVLVRSLSGRLPVAPRLEAPSLSRITGLTVDITAAAAISAVRVDKLDGQMGVILVFGITCAIATLLGCVWLGSRAFERDRFGHVLVLFGTMTGTLPTGLALLRLADPGLAGPAPRSMVSGTTGAALMGLPLILFVLPFAVSGWPDRHLERLGLTIAILVVYAAVLIFAWWRFAGLRLIGGPLWAPEAPQATRAPTP